MFKDRFAEAEMIRWLFTRWQLAVWLSTQEIKDAASSFKYEQDSFSGDAASLVDPFSGEGVGNALVTGEMWLHGTLSKIFRSKNTKKEVWAV